MITPEEHFRSLENMYLSAVLNREVYKGVALKISSGKATLTHISENRFFHAGGSLHGSVYFKMLDDAAYFAANSLVTDYFLYTVSFQTQILRPLGEDNLRAEGVVIKPGSSLIIAEARLYDSRGRLAATGLGQFMKSAVAFADIPGYKT